MKSVVPGRRLLIVGVFLSVGLCAATHALAANSKSSGRIKFTDENQGEATFKFDGFEEQVGRFTAQGELDFIPGKEEGTFDGTGVVILNACGGRLVGVVTSQFNSDTNECDFHFSWRDSVTAMRCLRTSCKMGRTGSSAPTDRTRAFPDPILLRQLS